jgi:hypothetical protein
LANNRWIFKCPENKFERYADEWKFYGSMKLAFVAASSTLPIAADKAQE